MVRAIIVMQRKCFEEIDLGRLFTYIRQSAITYAGLKKKTMYLMVNYFSNIFHMI